MVTLHRGRVTKAGASGVTVTIPALDGSELGPLDWLAPHLDDHVFTDNSYPASSTETLTHSTRLKAGDRVLVAELDEDDFIVVGRIASGSPDDGSGS